MDIWQRAQGMIEKSDQQKAWSLGFFICQQCGEWFSLSSEGWEDCVACGSHCPACADSISWQSCEICGFTYCESCFSDADSFTCAVCSVES